MKQYLISFALLTLIACNNPTTDNIPTEQYTTIETYDTIVEPIAVDMDQNHGELVLMPDSYYLNHPSIPDSAKLLYTKKIKPSDENYTFAVFDSLETANDTLLPFYFYTTLIISEQSDGAVSDMVGLTIYSFAYQHPRTLQKLLALPDVLPTSTNKEVWLEWTLSEISIDSDENELQGIELFGELMIRNSNNSATVAFTSQYIQDLKSLVPKRKQP